MQTIYLIKLIENGFYRGGIFYKKSNKFEYPESFDSAVKYYAMTKDNAEIEYGYLTGIGHDCFIDPIVINDNKGGCAYSLNSVKRDIIEHMGIDPCTVYPVEAICDYLWNSSFIDISNEDCADIMDSLVNDKTCNIEYHIPSGGYLYVTSN